MVYVSIVDETVVVGIVVELVVDELLLLVAAEKTLFKCKWT